jgi:putative lipoprotein
MSAMMDPRMRQAEAARIERGGKLMLTQAHGNRIKMVLHMVAKP